MRRVSLLALAAAFLLAPAPTQAAAHVADIANDSELVLTEHVEWGAYRDYAVSIRLHKKKATLVAVKDGHPTVVQLPYRQTMELWGSLQSSGMEDLADAPEAIEYPDQSQFNLQYRVMGERGGFRAYAVDTLQDSRYRSVVREILALADTHAKLAAEKAAKPAKGKAGDKKAKKPKNANKGGKRRR